jgi:hypothetical protein
VARHSLGTVLESTSTHVRHASGRRSLAAVSHRLSLCTPLYSSPVLPQVGEDREGEEVEEGEEGGVPPAALHTGWGSQVPPPSLPASMDLPRLSPIAAQGHTASGAVRVLDGLPCVPSFAPPRVGVAEDDVGPGVMGVPQPMFDPGLLRAVAPPGRWVGGGGEWCQWGRWWGWVQEGEGV